ncbi:MAG: 5-formyltetrahydrofolate cyclo-ligase [Pyrinomonadaceae bacterium]
MNKTQMRTRYLARQKALAPGERGRLSGQIADLFFDSVDLKSAEAVHCFITIQKFNEIDTSLIFERMWKELAHIRTLAPRVNFQSQNIESVVIGHSTHLEENEWKILEPGEGERVAPTDIDVVLVPGLAFDESGHRVGYGRGFYDRFLERCRPDCLKVGLSYFEPILQITDIHAGDMKLDLLITPRHAISTAF